jgi:DNA-binding transcriptional ArsR family regulator
MTTAIAAPEDVDFKALQRRSRKAASFLKALSNRDRLLLMCCMVQGEQCVTDLHSLSGITQPTLSQQLGVLRRRGLVQTRRDGKRIYYSIKDPSAVTVLETLHGIFCPPPQARADGRADAGT